MQLVRSSRRIYDANAVLKLFFLANSGKKRRDQNWPRDDEDQGRKNEKAMTRGNELVSFLVIATKWTYYVRKEAV